MKKLILFSLFIFSFAANGQVISSKKWTDLFSYNNVLAIKEDDGKLICATENGIFFYNISSGEISKLSKANGLHEVKITAFDYDPATNTGLVGYKTGAMDIITDSGVTLAVDIPIAQGFTGDKKINHISISGERAVVSVDYGVSIFDLKKKEFGLSCFFVTGGTYEPSNEATIKGDKAYAATNSGLKTHDINVTFPVYSTWTTVMAGSFTQIDSESVVAFGNSTNVFYENGGTFSPIAGGYGNIQDIVVTAQNITVTDDLRIYVYNTSGIQQANSTMGESCNTATYAAGQIYGGTKLSGLKDQAGVIYKPDGPYKNEAYKISLLNDQIWVASGGRASYNNPIYRDLGYYHFDGKKWQYPDYFIDNPITFNVLDVIANPAEPSKVWFTNYSFITGEKGVYAMENNTFKKVYVNEGSPYQNRIAGLTFDENNHLFVSASVFDTSPTFGYYYYQPSADTFTRMNVIDAGGAEKPLTKDGILYVPAPYFGDGGLLIKRYGTNPGDTSGAMKMIRVANGLPANGTVSVAVDTNDDVWIGTRAGLRILHDVQSTINSTNPQAEPIIIEQNGIGEELFRDNGILQIAVDSGNHKWVSVDGGGAYYLSPNGEQTIKHFTKENSPIPNNQITDIKVDEKTGKVYFVTLDGIVVYQGDVADVTSNFGNILVYPNPVVYSNFRGKVTIKGLAMKTNIRIVDATGNLVHQAIARGGFYEWDLNNQRGKRVASGVYFVLMTNEDGSDKATAKIAVVN